MKKKTLAALILLLGLSLTACAEEEAANDTDTDVATTIEVDDKDPFAIPDYHEAIREQEQEEEEITPEPEITEIPDPVGMYMSELTGEWIDESLKDQRPIAVMVDNEKTALDHYGVNDCDIVYEMMNSTLNGRITRLMCLKKDWVGTERLGSVRSVRPTNIMIAAEYNAILIHDGGPKILIEDYIAQPYCNHLDSGFARYNNGKHWEYTEYVTYETYKNPDTGKSYKGLGERLEEVKFSKTYNEYYKGDHFVFSREELDLSQRPESKPVVHIEMPFPHNESMLNYRPEEGTYAYSEYGRDHIDPLDDNRVTTFKNLIIIGCSFFEYGEGYLCYNVENGSGDGYYLTNGYSIPITWSKEGQSGVMQFVDKTSGEPLTINIGKSYIAIVPLDVWDQLVLSDGNQ